MIAHFSTSFLLFILFHSLHLPLSPLLLPLITSLPLLSFPLIFHLSLLLSSSSLSVTNMLCSFADGHWAGPDLWREFASALDYKPKEAFCFIVEGNRLIESKFFNQDQCENRLIAITDAHTYICLQALLYSDPLTKLQSMMRQGQ